MADIDPLTGVSVFVAAARLGSFTLAAERLGVTKSAVGKTVARLEDRLGVKLFNRTTRSFRLTADGEAYLAACSTALEEINAAQEALSTSSRVLSGRLHIDMPVAFGRAVLLPILIDLTRAHPELTLTLNFTDATSDILQDDVDLAIRFGVLRDSTNLVARHLVSQPRIICASPAYLARHGVPTSLADLRHHRCVLGAAKGPPLAWFVIEAGEEKRISPPVTHQLSDGQAMVDAATAGLGICQVPVSIVRNQLARGELQPVLEAFAGALVDVHAVWPRRARLSPRVRYVVDELIQQAALGHLG
ncbi:LysR family transcriptional regulator [Sphingomonas sp. BIUV-7]|uniref:LysR family transcriptional regulator n=1 Tax=Sphingomonas natans TaxID=3063330 RepID=A0ABT8YAD3_9SPHN|nr:LysR family transcriptional regulator [Sphingomonas sp. BIUV-7]MDO6415297.1 LysR family transcriptional regulator [Sphingomonas sp. BIUV-7]